MNAILAPYLRPDKKEGTAIRSLRAEQKMEILVEKLIGIFSALLEEGREQVLRAILQDALVLSSEIASSPEDAKRCAECLPTEELLGWCSLALNGDWESGEKEKRVKIMAMINRHVLS